MTKGVFYPYLTAGEVLDLTIDPIDPALQILNDGSIAAWDVDQPVLVLNVQISLPSNVIESVLPATESPTNVALRLVARSVTGRSRRLIYMEENGSGASGKAELRLDEFAGAIDLQAVLVRTSVTQTVVPGYASDKGSLLAWSRVGTVHLEEPTPPAGNYLEIYWKKFSEGDPWLVEHRDQLFAIDPSHDPSPKLYLNEEFMPNIRAVLDGRGTTGAKARTRDAAFGLIAHQVWSSLLSTAFDELGDVVRIRQAEEVADDEVDSPFEELPHEWSRSVLLDWATSLYPERDPEDARDQIVQAVLGGGTDELLLRRMPSAIQQKAPTVKGITGLIKEVLER